MKEATDDYSRQILIELQNHLDDFEVQRTEAETSDEPLENPLKHFTGIAHILWWALSNLKQNTHFDFQVPGHEGFDDFLCLSQGLLKTLFKKICF